VTTAAVEDVRVAPLPRSFLVWLSGAMASQVGDAALYFALAWAASARGGPAAGLVLSSIALPRTVLLLLGGAVGDRFGARRVMIIGDGIMLVVAAALAAASWTWGTPLALLLTAGLVIGTVDAFYLPSSGSMPRQLAARGLAIIAAGELILGLSPVKVIAVLGAVMMGVGTAAFVCNLAPVPMGSTPRTHLARIQSLLSLAQSAALLVFNNVLGAVAHVASAAGAMITCASIVFACALAAVLVPTIRRIG
jgi:hypothetical protein